MKQPRSLKQRLTASVLVLVMMLSTFLGTTFAWFTDSVTSTGNQIQTGSLKADLLHKVGDDWVSLKEHTNHKVFDYDKWEPGFTAVETLKVANFGTLALQWRLSLSREDGSAIVGKNGEDLAEVIDVYVAYGENSDNSYEEITANGAWLKKGTLAEAMKNPASFIGGQLVPTGEVLEDNSAVSLAVGNQVIQIALHMQENAGNAYQELSVGNLFVNLVATQWSYENDSFDNGYDKDAVFPELNISGITVDVTTENNVVTKDATVNGIGVMATIPAGVAVRNGVNKLGLSVTEKTASDANLTLNDGEALRSLDVHMDGVASTNTVPMLITVEKAMKVGLNIGNYTLYHVEGGVSHAMTAVEALAELDAHNEFYYDPATGDVTLAMATFSEVAMVAETENAWEGKFDYTWYDASKTELTIANADQLAALGAIVGGMNGQTQDSFAGKTIKLLADINLGGVEAQNNSKIIFYPIGYYNNTGSYEKTSGGSVTSSVSSFEGTFDGNGNTIANFYQNTWEMFGDYNDGYSGTPNHYKDAMGLFGYVLNGTVKNLTVSNFSSDGEFTPTGVIAAYADGNSTFENIAITDCNPRVYNTGNGGIIGVAGDTSAANDDHITLKNITVDKTNQISALWGSWDVACGGLVGMYRGNVDGSGNATGDTIDFVNCHVSAIIDVYNDVCANYQYYAYRYSGMIIGSVRHNTKNAEGKTIPNMTGISATGCTVNYGDWNDYYYCEFEKNSMASYSEDYQFSRVPHSELNFTDSNGNGVVDADERASVTGCKHTHTAEENHQAIYLPFHQLFTGYSWGVSSIGLEKYSGIVTNLDITEGDQEESVEKFETKFTGDFLYRVGNKNTVSIGSLFAAKNGKTISNAGVWVTVQKLDENMNVSGKFTANTTDWTKGTIEFSGTGVVKVTIQDYNFCTPTVLYLEVVDAVNATTATSATSNNVVLLNDCGFGSLEVSGGYTLYGNGFTLTCGSDSASLSFGQFVTLDSGTLDNVQIVCPNYDYAALYNSQLTGENNRSQTTDKTRYYNAKSAVLATGNSQILNSRISGGRAAIYTSNGNIVVDNSRLEGGAVATVIIGAANSFVFRDTTLVQKPTVSTYDSTKTLMGMSVLYLCNTDGEATHTTLEGDFVQYAWVDSSCTAYMPAGTSGIASTVLGKTNYAHEIDGKTCVNLGFAYMPNEGTKVNQPANIVDSRSNASKVPYAYEAVSATVPVNSMNVNISTYVYSYQNTNGTEDSFKAVSEYKPNRYSDIVTVTYADTAYGLTTGKSYGTNGWIYELNVDLDTLKGYELDFNKLAMSVNGVIVTDFNVNGGDKPASPIVVTPGGTIYTLTAIVNDKEYTATLKITGVETSKEAPTLIQTTWGAGQCVTRKDNGGSTNYTGAAPVLEGIIVRYWSVAQSQYIDLELPTITPTNSTALNGTNNYWEYSEPNGDYTLKITNTAYVHDGNKVYAMPVAYNNVMYFVASSENGFVSTGSGARSIAIKYEFTDNNGNSLTFDHTWSVAYSNSNPLSYQAMTGIKDGCVTPDTLVTLADGTQVRVDSLTGNEELLVWNMETGKLDKAPIMFIDSEEEAEFEIIHLYFSDGTDVKVIYEHGFWDYDLNQYVYLDANAADYIGHTFAKQNGDSLEKVQLVDVVIETEVTTAWSPVTAGHLCYFVNGMLSMPGGVGGLFNIFEVDAETMTYDYEQMQKDIETYGLYTYEELNAICPLSEKMFNEAGGAYLKISIAKGNLTVDELIAMILRYSKFFN